VVGLAQLVDCGDAKCRHELPDAQKMGAPGARSFFYLRSQTSSSGVAAHRAIMDAGGTGFFRLPGWFLPAQSDNRRCSEIGPHSVDFDRARVVDKTGARSPRS
jgi:hypothetical protein